jgi:hypothetical protein
MPPKKAKPPLAKTHPKLAKEADGWDPKDVTAGSGRKMAWKCSDGHTWIASPHTRTGKSGTNCPICSNRKVLAGFNDLATTHPELAKQAYGWDPTTVVAGTEKKYSWLCLEGHEWSSSISNRTRNKSNCPTCARVKKTKLVKKRIKRNRLGLTFTHPKIAKQAFGWDPDQVMASSKAKLEWKCSLGHHWKAMVTNRTKAGGNNCPICSNYQVLAGFNDLATTHPELAKQAYGWDPTTVVAGSHKKLSWICNTQHVWAVSPGSRISGNTSCPICSNNKVLKGFNDLATTHPELAKEAFEWDATLFSAGSGVKRKWKCKEYQHVYEAKISHRAGLLSACPICSNQQVLAGFNDLATTHPELAMEANGWEPSKIVAGTHKKKSWKCPLGHIYSSKVNNRTSANKRNCPICSNYQVLAGFNDLATTHPEIAKEVYNWNPSTVLAGSGSKKKWICANKHIYTASLVNRTSAKSGCPKCAKYGFNPIDDGFLYLLNHPNWKMLQIGITNFPDARLANHQKTGWELIEIRGPMDGYLTKNWESAILKMLKTRGADLSNEKIAGKFDGYSEAWSKSKFPIKSIKELMQLTEEYEEEKSVTNLSHKKTKKD